MTVTLHATLVVTVANMPETDEQLDGADAADGDDVPADDTDQSHAPPAGSPS